MGLKAKPELFPEIEAVFQGLTDGTLEFKSKFDLLIPPR